MKPRARLGIAAAISAIVGWVYWPALQGGFVSDDSLEVTQNPALRSLAGLGRIWSGAAGLDYLPVKGTVQWVEWQLWGGHAWGYHAVNVVLHLASAFLLWRILQRLGVKHGWVGALLFAVHPLAVESVAWISELKNTLSESLLLLAFDAHVRWDQETGADPRARWPQRVLPFAASLLAKGSGVMFPVCLLLYGAWRRGKIARRDWLAALPLAGLALAVGGITLELQTHRAMADVRLPLGGPGVRLVHAVQATAFYLWKTLAPLHTAFVYDRPAFPAAAAAVLVLAVLGLAAAAWIRGGRGGAFGIGWFLLNLLPVLGFLPMAYLRYSAVADRFAYLSLLGLAGLAAAAASVRTLRWALIAVACGFACLSRIEAGAFRNELALWTRTVTESPRSWVAHNNLGLALAAEGRTADALAAYDDALRCDPDEPEPWSNRGLALLQLHRPGEAADAMATAVARDPDSAQWRNNHGAALRAAGQNLAAIAEYRRAVELAPGDAQTAYNLGLAYFDAGLPSRAIEWYGAALAIDPALAEAENNLGVALAHSGRLEEAQVHYRRALALRARYPEAENNLGLALAKSGRPDLALPHFAAAVAEDPDYAAARRNLELARRLLRSAPPR